MRTWKRAAVLVVAVIVAAGVAGGAAANGGAAAGGGRDNGVVVPVASAPALDKVVSLAPYSLKTKGKSPEEAFNMLGQVAGVGFVPLMDSVVGGGIRRTVWEKPYPPVDFDVEEVNFWQAALRLGNRAEVIPAGDGYSFTLRSMNPNYRPPVQTLNTSALHVALYADKVPGESPLELNLEFLLDPRLAVYAVGELNILEGKDDGTGRLVDWERTAVKWPGDAHARTGTRHGILSISSGGRIAAGRLPVRMAVFRGNLAAVVATASKRLEWNIVNGEVADQMPHRVGDWTITASQSRAMQMPTRGTGPARPDREFTLKVERMSDKAPPFPERKEAIVHFAGSPGSSMAGVFEPAAKDPLVQEWLVRLVTRAGNGDPVTKVIVDVPLEVKAVVLPFEFKNLVLGWN